MTFTSIGQSTPSNGRDTKIPEKNPNLNPTNTGNLANNSESAVPELSCDTRGVQNTSATAAATTLSSNDIETVCKICETAWNDYFSKPLPTYEGMQVYWDGKLQLFSKLDRDTQIKIIKSAHISNVKSQDLEKQKNTSADEFKSFVSHVVGFHPGKLLYWHGIGHAVRTAIMAQLSCIEYVKNFEAFRNMSSRVLLCAVAASLLHDIGRCLGGDMYDIFGETSAYIAGEILTKVGGFSKNEIESIKKAIDIGGINKDTAEETLKRNNGVLDGSQMIACLMGDADSYEFERFGQSNPCQIKYTSIKMLGFRTKNNEEPDVILNALKKRAKNITGMILEPWQIKNIGPTAEKINYIDILKNALTDVNTYIPDNTIPKKNKGKIKNKDSICAENITPKEEIKSDSQGQTKVSNVARNILFWGLLSLAAIALITLLLVFLI